MVTCGIYHCELYLANSTMLWLFSVLESMRKSHKTRNLSKQLSHDSLCSCGLYAHSTASLMRVILRQRNIVLASGVESAPFKFANASSRSRSSSPRRAIHASGPSRSPCDSFNIGHGSSYSTLDSASFKREATPQKSAPSSAGPHRSHGAAGALH